MSRKDGHMGSKAFLIDSKGCVGERSLTSKTNRRHCDKRRVTVRVNASLKANEIYLDVKQEHEMKNQIIRFMKDEEGATAIEYGLIAGLISVAIVGVVTTVGTDLGAVFTEISTKLQAAIAPAPAGGGT